MENQQVQTSVNEELLRQQASQQYRAMISLEREYVLSDFTAFCQVVMRWPDFQVGLHDQLCRFLQDNRHKKRLILFPRGHLKSTIATVSYALWRIAQDQSIRILIANGTYDLATTFLAEIKDHLQNNAKFIELFGDLKGPNPEKWSENMITVKRKGTRVGKEPTVTAFGIGGNLVSQHYDLIICDDIVNRDNTHTPERIADVNTFYKDLQDLRDSERSEQIFIGTRWHEGDLYGTILDPDNPDRSQFAVYQRQAVEGDYQFVRNAARGTYEIEGGEIIFPNKFSREGIAGLISSKGMSEFCTPHESPILMADFSVKPIGEIREGDSVMGFSFTEGSRKRRLVPTTVKRVSRLNAPVQTMVMASGRKVRCTPQHRWYTGKEDGTHLLYRPARVGSKLLLVDPVGHGSLSSQEVADWSYLAGFFDGEGSTKSGGCLTLTQGANNEYVLNRVKAVLNRLGIEWSEYIKKAGHSVRQPNDCSMLWLKNNFETSLKLLRYGSPAKSVQIVEKMLRHSSNFVRLRDEVVSIEVGVEEEVYALGTTTGNYVVWGYASSNSAQYMNDPVPSETAIFKHEFRYYEEEDIRGQDLHTYVLIDPTFYDPQVKKAEPDYTAAVVVSVNYLNDWFIRDIINQRLQPQELIELIFQLDTLWKPKTTAIESNAMQRILAYAARQQMRNRNHFPPITELQHAGRNARSKAERIQALEPRYAVGTIYHNKNVRHNTTLETQLRRFPRGKFDDIIDALASGVEVIVPPKRASQRDEHNGSWLSYPA